MNNDLKAAAAAVNAATDRLLEVSNQGDTPIVPVKLFSLFDKLNAIPDGSKAFNYKPMAVVNTRKGIRGVFWKGEGRRSSGPTVGIRKLTNSGRLYKRNKFDGTRFVSIAALCDECDE